MKHKITVLRIDDWTGVYIDDELFNQHHDVPLSDVMKAIDQPYEEYWVDTYYDALCENGDEAPADFDEGYPFPEKLTTWEKWCKDIDGD